MKREDVFDDFVRRHWSGANSDEGQRNLRQYERILADFHKVRRTRS